MSVVKIDIKPKDIPHEVIKKEIEGLRAYVYHHPFIAEILFSDGEKISVDVKSSRCHQPFYIGNYEVSGIGDTDGYENTCGRCGTKVWGPVYINLESRWRK